MHRKVLIFNFTVNFNLIIFVNLKFECKVSFILPDGVTGNTPDSGSGKSRFDP